MLNRIEAVIGRLEQAERNERARTAIGNGSD
jgi:hypothetical protein